MTFPSYSLFFQRLRAVSAGVGISLLCLSILCLVAPGQAQTATPTNPSEPEEASKSAPLLPPAPIAPVETAPDTSEDKAPPAEALLAEESPTVAAGPDETLRSAITRLNLPLPFPDARIVIYKKERTLELFSGQSLIKTYRMALGFNPGGHKQNQGDGRTPEGQFYICTRNAKNSAFHIFLGLSYPALPDATRAVNEKIITWRDYQIIRQRLSSRGAPLWETRLGGWVGIHGGTDGSFAARKKRERNSSDWTAGCIALTDKEIAEVHAATKIGTPVLILP